MSLSPLVSPNPNLILDGVPEQPKLGVDNRFGVGFWNDIGDLADFKVWIESILQQHRSASEDLIHIEIAALKADFERAATQRSRLQEPSLGYHQLRPEDEQFENEVLAGNFKVVLHSISALSDAHNHEMAALRAEIERLKLDTGEAPLTSCDDKKNLCDLPLISSTPDKFDNGDVLCTAQTHHDHARAIRVRTDEKLQKFLHRAQGCNSKHLRILLESEDGRGLRKFLRGPFDLVMAFIISLNAVCMVVQLQLRGQEAASSLGLSLPHGTWEDAKAVFVYTELIFALIFLAEFLFRLAILRISYFYDPVRGLQALNIFDMLIVMITSVDAFSKDVDNDVFAQLRLVRIGRAIRGLRVVRIMYLFSTLRVLTRTIIHSFFAFIWSMLLLQICMLVATMFLCQTFRGYILNPDLDFDTRLWLFRYYGTTTRTFYTMFEITFSGCWPNFARRIVEEVNGMYAIFFMLYASVIVFAVTRIITALFLKDTLAVAASDACMMIEEKTKARAKYVDQLHSLFVQADASGDGLISWEEFELILSNTKVRGLFAHLELDIFEVSGLFNLLDNGDGQITYSEFVQGVMRLKGQARAFDVIKVSRDCDSLLERCDELQSCVDRMELALARIK